jgi:hypothetical protein
MLTGFFYGEMLKRWAGERTYIWHLAFDIWHLSLPEPIFFNGK